MVEKTEKIGLRKEDALNRAKSDRRSASNCRRNGLILAITAKETTLHKN